MKKEKPKYKWKLTFELKNTKLENSKELKGRNILLKQVGKNQVHGEIFFDTDFSDERLPLIVEEKLNDFLNITALYHFNIGIDETFVLEKYNYKIDNSMELIEVGIKVPTIGTLATHSDVILSKKFIDEFPDRIQKLNSSNYKHYFDNILRQYRIAYMQDDPYIRYEQLWITFISMLNALKTDPDWDDKKSISDFASGSTRTLNKIQIKNIVEALSKSAWNYDIMILGPHMKEEGCSNFIDFLIKLKIPIWKKTDTYSNGLDSLLKKEQKSGNINIYDKFMKILFCLYGIRNQLFHRTKYFHKELDIGRMRLSCFILATIIRISINSYVTKYTNLK